MRFATIENLLYLSYRSSIFSSGCYVVGEYACIISILYMLFIIIPTRAILSKIPSISVIRDFKSLLIMKPTPVGLPFSDPLKYNVCPDSNSNCSSCFLHTSDSPMMSHLILLSSFCNSSNLSSPTSD